MLVKFYFFILTTCVIFDEIIGLFKGGELFTNEFY